MCLSVFGKTGPSVSKKLRYMWFKQKAFPSNGNVFECSVVKIWHNPVKIFNFLFDDDDEEKTTEKLLYFIL